MHGVRMGQEGVSGAEVALLVPQGTGQAQWGSEGIALTHFVAQGHGVVAPFVAYGIVVTPLVAHETGLVQFGAGKISTSHGWKLAHLAPHGDVKVAPFASHSISAAPLVAHETGLAQFEAGKISTAHGMPLAYLAAYGDVMVHGRGLAHFEARGSSVLHRLTPFVAHGPGVANFTVHGIMLG